MSEIEILILNKIKTIKQKNNYEAFPPFEGGLILLTSKYMSEMKNFDAKQNKNN